MDGFKKFIENADNEAKDSVKSLPKSHQKLLRGFSFEFEGGCNLKGYPDSIGLVHLENPKKKIIKIAAPWRYGREFAFLHEIGHIVWNSILTKEQKKEWNSIIKKTRSKFDKSVAKQDREELFCHTYAQYHCKNKVLKFNIPECLKFIEKLT